MRQASASGALAAVWLLASATVIGEARADAVRGLALAGQSCSQCHGLRPNDSSPNPNAPSFPAIAAEPSATAMSLRVFLRTPHPSLPNLILQQDDIDDLVDYILSLKPSR